MKRLRARDVTDSIQKSILCRAFIGLAYEGLAYPIQNQLIRLNFKKYINFSCLPIALLHFIRFIHSF